MANGFDENAADFKLDFLDPGDVTRGEKFESIVPILWMLAGRRGACEVAKAAGKWFIPEGNPFAVLHKEDAFGAFLHKLTERPDIDHVFLVTDSTEAFHEMAAELGHKYKAIQLYRSYIDTFRINLTEPGTITPGGVPVIPMSAPTLTPAARGGTMRFNLKDFQIEAADALMTKLETARFGAARKQPQAVVLNSPTGSGKTVIIVEMIERILRGHAGTTGDPRGFSVAFRLAGVERTIQEQD